jgi:hypothetical protein
MIARTVSGVVGDGDERPRRDPGRTTIGQEVR